MIRKIKESRIVGKAIDMAESNPRCVRYTLRGSLALIILGVVLCICFPFTSCLEQETEHYPQCYRSNYSHSCHWNDERYCCNAHSYRCDNNCIKVDSYITREYERCEGVLELGLWFLGLGSVCAVCIFLIVRMAEARMDEEGGYRSMELPTMKPHMPQPTHPTIIYPDELHQISQAPQRRLQRRSTAYPSLQ